MNITNRILITIMASVVIFTLIYLGAETNRIIAKQDAQIELLKVEKQATTDSLTDAYVRINEIYKLTWDNIDYWINYFGIAYPEIVKAQIYEETGNLTSDLCVFNHNLFGMKFPGTSRPTSAVKEINGFSYYGSYVESIQDYAYWQQSRYTDASEDYYTFLIRIGYCYPDATEYAVRVRYIVDNGLTSY